jgi:hypothetical protein
MVACLLFDNALVSLLRQPEFPETSPPIYDGKCSLTLRRGGLWDLDRLPHAAVLFHSAGSDVAELSATKDVSGSKGEVTSQSLPVSCPFTISSARSMLAAWTATLKRAAPLLT